MRNPAIKYLTIVVLLGLSGSAIAHPGHSFGGSSLLHHFSEMDHFAAPVLYALGFLLATAALYFSCITLGLSSRGRFLVWVQATGAAIALSGVWMLSQLT